MKTETEMGKAGPLRWRALFLAVVLLPAAAWGEQTASEKLKEQLDRRLWKEVGGCPGAERYLKALPEGLHAGDARECLAAEKEGKEEARRRMKRYEEGAYRALERGNVAGARQRLEELRKLDETAPGVMDLEDAIAEAEERLKRMRRYAQTGREALRGGDLAKARRYVERLRELDAKSPLAVELEEAIVEAEAERKEREAREAEERRQAQAERERKRKEREAEEQRRAAAEAERKRKAEAEEAARRARAEAERRRKEREAEERRLAEAERERKRKAREEEERRRAAVEESYWRMCEHNDEARYCEEYLLRYEDGVHARQARRRLAELAVPPPGTTFRDCPGCPEMVVVPEGRFEMGSPESEEGRWDDGREGPGIPVAIGYRLAVGVHEVTRGEFARFVSATGRSMGDSCWTYEGGEWEERSGRHWKSPGFSQADDHPVVCVNWDDAQAYVRWLSRETGETYRLLSEAEWEYVARAETTTARYWGESERGQCRYANGADETYGWTGAFCDDGHARTSPVGSFQANGYKLHDVLGNVWEWTEDCWNNSYAGAPADGSAWTSGECGRRVLRGGSWGNFPRNLRSAFRSWDSAGVRYVNYGFRVARTLTP